MAGYREKLSYIIIALLFFILLGSFSITSKASNTSDYSSSELLGHSSKGISNEPLNIAWQIALKKNFRLKSVEQSQLSAQEQQSEAESMRLPSLILSANYLSLDNPPTIQANFAGTDFNFSYWQENALYYSAYSSVPLYTSGKITQAVRAAKQNTEAARFDTLTEKQHLKMMVAKAYVNILRANHALLLAESHVISLEQHKKDVSNLKQQGLVSNSDLLSAQVSLSDARQVLSQTRNQSDLAYSAYNQLLGRELHFRPVLQEPAPNMPGDDLNELTAHALQQRNELFALRKRIKALQHRVLSTKAESGPQVVLGGGYAYQENENQLYEELWFANLGMAWKVFDGGVTRHRTKNLNHQANALTAQYDNLNELIQLQVRQAWLKIIETEERTQVTLGSIQEANENLKITRNRYREGLASHSEVLDAETLRTLSESNYSNARYDSILAKLQLRRAIGEL